MLYCLVLSTDVDTDMILTKDLVTLDEAVRTANNVVLLAMTAVSVLTSVSFFFSVFNICLTLSSLAILIRI